MPPIKIESVAKHLLLFAATTGYQIRVFADAARRLGVDVTLATDRCHIMDDPWGDHAIAVKFDRIADSVDVLRGLHFGGGHSTRYRLIRHPAHAGKRG